MTGVVAPSPVRWTDFAAADPTLASRIAARFAAGPHHVMATIRADGSPRLSGTNVFIADELRIGMMPGALRATDLRRDPRCALHSSPDDADMSLGDARLDCVAVEMSGPDASAWFASLGDQPTEGHCFVLLVSRAVLTTVTAGRLQVESWTPDGGRAVTHRR